MNQQQLDKLTYNILSGIVKCRLRNVVYEVYAPTDKLRSEAEDFVEELRYKYRFAEWYTPKEIKEILIHNGIITQKTEENLKEINKSLEDLKVELYDSILDSEKSKGIRKTLVKVEAKQNETFIKLSSLDHFTLDGYCASEKYRYIMALSTYHQEKPLWNTFYEVDSQLLDTIIMTYTKERPSFKEIREIARNEPWRSYWGANNKSSPFKNEFLTDEQRSLILYTKMYDNVYEHGECPSENIINDDDLLDGWLIKQRRERDKNKMTNELSKNEQLQKHGNASEIYLPAKSAAQANKINQLNDTRGQVIKKQREAAVKRGGVVKEESLPDVKQGMLIQANKKYADTAKGRK